MIYGFREIDVIYLPCLIGILMASGNESEEYDLYDFSSSSTDDDIQDVEDEFQMLFQFSSAASSSTQVFLTQEFGEHGLVNHGEGVRDALAALQATPNLFRVITNFTLTEFEELCGALIPVIVSNTRSTGSMRLQSGRPYKLSPEQQILNSLLYLKHDNIAALDSFTWNWAKSSILDDTIYISSCINEVLCHELRLPTAAERVIAGRELEEFPGCIGTIDGTLIRIRRPWSDPNHGRYYNGRKKMYFLNSLVVVDHPGLFIYIEPGFPGAYHDINVLRHSDLNASWREYFTYTNSYFEYLLGDPGYQARETFIMRRVAD